MTLNRYLILLMLSLSLCFPVYIFAGVIQLPKTGQMKCYDSAGTIISCTDTGQDGDIQAGATWPTPRFAVTYCNATAPCTDQSSDCDSNALTDVMTDNLTGLMWPNNANLSGQMDWSSALDSANNLVLCGYADWHLPNVNELASLINANVPHTHGWLYSNGFYNVQAYGYWSSTTYASYTGSAWIVFLRGGAINDHYKYISNTYSVWPVRSGKPGMIQLPQTGQKTMYKTGDDGDLKMGVEWSDPRFVVNGDCVTDNLTGLMWTRNANLAGYMQWQQAIDYANELTLCVFSDWRLPNRKELSSLIDYSNYNPVLPADTPFTNVQSGDY